MGKNRSVILLIVVILYTILFYFALQKDTEAQSVSEDNTKAQSASQKFSYSIIHSGEHSTGYIETRDFTVTKLIVTAYAPLDNKSGICADGNPSVTSTGTYPKRGTVAVNPKVFSYGTEFYIPGYGFGTAEDTGGAIRRSTRKIDVVMDSYEEAMEWGVREVFVVVYE